MADKSESEKRRKHKKKQKKITKSSGDDPESSAFTSADTNASQNEKTATPERSPAAAKESKASPQKLAPKSQGLKSWTLDQEDKLLRNVKKYSSKLTGKQQHSHRVDWSKVEQVDDFTQFDMQDQYKMLTKKVRKSRSVQEVVDDALILHKEAKRFPAKGKKINKQPPNAFSIFCKAKRPSLVEKHPELKFGEVHKKLCEKWKELPEEKREKYVIKAEKAKSEYYAEIKKIHDQQISEIKKPMSAYDLWKSERIQDEDLDGDETENDFFVEWEKLPKSTKKGWLQAAASEKEKYDLEVFNVTGSSSKEIQKIAKDKKSIAETKSKEKSESDSQWQSLSSPENSGLKRKANSLAQIAKSPVKKIVKKEASSHSESSESDSSDED